MRPAIIDTLGESIRQKMKQWRAHELNQIFQAGTQYNDFVGTVAADRSDSLDFAEYLRGKGLLRDNEHLVGFEIVFNENSGAAMPNPGIVAYLGQGDGVDAVASQRDRDGIVTLRIVEVDGLPLADFFAYFKRFNVMFANKGLNISGAEYQTVE